MPAHETVTTSEGRGGRLLLALGGECAFACLVALVASAPPAIEATVAFGLAVAIGLELQARRAVPHAASRGGTPPGVA